MTFEEEHKMRILLVKHKMIVLILPLLLVSCIHLYMPVPQAKITVDKDTAFMATDSTNVAIRYDQWSVDPQFLFNYFTTIYINVYNHSPHKITIQPHDFVLLDENNIQYDLFLYDEVISYLFEDAENYLLAGRGNHNSRFEQPNSPHPPNRRSENPHLIPSLPQSRYNTPAARLTTYKRNIQRNSFNFGEIVPGGAREGIIFFIKLDSVNNEFSIVHNDERIYFTRKK